MKLGEPVDPNLPWVRTIDALKSARACSLPAVKIAAFEQSGRRLGDSLRSGPKVLGVRTLDNTTLPYPARFAFNGALSLPWPMVLMHHRTLLVKLQTEQGVRHVLFNPTDRDSSRATPFFRKLEERMLRVAPFAERLLAKAALPIEDQLAAVGVSPEQIDAVAYDHFHTQDLRPILGDGSKPGRYPNARLLAPRREWEQWDALHPMQRAWFVADGKKGVPQDRVILFDDDVALGQGCLLLQTPGHTVGNQTLFVHSEEGVFGCSENGCSADNWAPHSSTIPGLARYARSFELDVVLNSNTPEYGGDQYASMMLERALVDQAVGNPDMKQMFPSSEVIPSAVAPGLRPRLVFGTRDGGCFAA